MAQASHPAMGEPWYHYTIFESPDDYPGEFVCRRFRIEGGGVTPEGIVARGRTLEEVREKLPVGLVPFGRDPSDQPSVVETWG